MATVGAVLMDEGEVEYFGFQLSDEQLRTLQRSTPKVITVLEVIPVVLAFFHWAPKLIHGRAFAFGGQRRR